MTRTVPYPQWRATRVTDWMGKTRWVAHDGVVYRHPQIAGKQNARLLAAELSQQERAQYKRWLVEGDA